MKVFMTGRQTQIARIQVLGGVRKLRFGVRSAGRQDRGGADKIAHLRMQVCRFLQRSMNEGFSAPEDGLSAEDRSIWCTGLVVVDRAGLVPELDA